MNIYTSIWNKYLPVLKIILKRAVSSDQVQSLKLDATDFEKVGSIRKANAKFSIQSENGKFTNAIKFPISAKDLVSVLMDEPTIKELFQQHDFMLTLTTKNEISIKHIPKPKDEVVAADVEDEAAENN